jgi:hypothetical protein
MNLKQQPSCSTALIVTKVTQSGAFGVTISDLSAPEVQGE